MKKYVNNTKMMAFWNILSIFPKLHYFFLPMFSLCEMGDCNKQQQQKNKKEQASFEPWTEMHPNSFFMTAVLIWHM